MKTHEKIRLFREANRLSQEEVATQLNMSSGGYSKIERGETKLYIEKLQKIAQVFNVNMSELLDDDSKDIFICINGDNSNHSNIKYSGNTELNHEIEKLQLMLQHKDEIIEQLRNELTILKHVIMQKT